MLLTSFQQSNFTGGSSTPIKEFTQYMKKDQLLEPGTKVSLHLRFISSPIVDNDVPSVSYEEEWLCNRKNGVKAKNAFWFFVPKLNADMAVWKNSLKALNKVKQIKFGSTPWDAIRLKELFQTDDTIELLNAIAQTSDCPIKLQFNNESVQDVFKDIKTQEYVVKLESTLLPADELIPITLRLFNVVYGFLRSFRRSTSGGELIHSLPALPTLLNDMNGLFLTTRDRLYDILNNGGTRFKVALLEPEAYIYKMQWEDGDNDIGDEELDGGSDQLLTSHLLLRVPYARAYVGINLGNSMTRGSKVSKRIEGDGNCIVLTLPTPSNRHVVIGARIYEFRTRDVIFERLLISIGNYGECYPWLLDGNGRVYLLNNMQSFSVKEEDKVGFGATLNILPIPSNTSDPYDVSMQVEYSGQGLDQILFALKLGKHFGFGRSVHVLDAFKPIYYLTNNGQTVKSTISDQVTRLEKETSNKASPWIEQPDGSRKTVTRKELIQVLKKVRAAADMMLGMQPFYKVRIIEDGV